METREFLQHVLPDCGEYIVWIRDTKRTFAGDLDTICKVIDEQNTKHTVYYAVSSYYPGGVRNQDSVAAVRACWLDLDSKEVSQAEQLKSLVGFVKTVGLPAPTLVHSGWGTHVYWTFENNVDPADWENTSYLLREATNRFGLKADHARTCDSSSLLRPVGTLNRKDPNNLKDVKLLKLSPHSSYQVFHDTLQTYVGEIVNPNTILTLNDDLSMERAPLPSVTSDRIADVCAQMDLFRSLKGDFAEPMWFAGLGVLAYTSDGVQKAQEWSSGHDKYDPVETEAKLQHASKQSGMTSCEALYRASPNPSLCTSCPFFQKCTTPRGAELQAARPNVISVLVEPSEGIFADVTGTTTVVEEEIYIPEGWAVFREPGGIDSIYRWTNTEMNWWDASPAEYMVKTNFSLMVRGILYSSGYLGDRNGIYQMNLKYMHGPSNLQRKELTVTGRQIASARELMSELGDKGIGSLSHMERHLADYIKSIRAYHQTRAEQKAMYGHFGWFEDDFLVGDSLYKPDGSIEKITLGKSVQEKAHHVKPEGSLDRWKEIIETAYNYPGCEALQFAVLTGFAAPLVSHFKNFGGLTVHLYSQGSGKGKTTAARAALSVWGNPDALQLTDKQATMNAIFATMGTMHHLPILYDEVTNKADEEIADLVHIISSGMPKQRCDSAGKVIENDHFWKTLVLTSGNKLLSDKLRSTRDNVEAEIARIFEVIVNVKPHIQPSQAIRLFAGFSDNYGVAGREYARYIAQNKVAVGQALDRALDQVSSKFSMQTSERFWSVMIASVLVANHICKHLGLMNFDKVTLVEWIKKTILLNRNVMVDVVPSVADAFGRLMAELWIDVIVSDGEGSFIGGRWADVKQKPRGKVTGRCIMDRLPQNNKVMLSETAVKTWCQKNGKNFSEFFAELVDNKLVSATMTRKSLGSGTMEFDRLPEVNSINITQATVAAILSNGKLEVISGGKEATKEAVK